MKNLKKLSRKELKDVNGGRKACSVTIQQSNGSWKTYSGECKGVIDDYTMSGGNGHMTLQVTASHFYCETGRGELAITSNGGVSRCN